VAIRPSASEPAVASAEVRVRRAIDAHHDLVWRTLRYLGVPDWGTEDATQQVFCVLATRIASVTPGTERPFVLSTAMRVAADARRKARRRPEALEREVERISSRAPNPEELMNEEQERRTLEEVIDAMPLDLRVVFVLFELEELSLAEIAGTLDLKVGTATSRLRRAGASSSAA
jgi:RNA polymerase sigma-70 factor (ECF subfamily)